MNITLASSTVTSLASSVSQTFTGLAPLIAIIIALVIAFYGLRRVIAFFPKR